MDTDVGVEIDNINDGHVFSETSEVYAFHIGEICIILDFVYHLLITLCYLDIHVLEQHYQSFMVSD
jgi:hypothetical protein